MTKNNYLNIFFITGSGIIAGLLNYIYHPIVLKYLTIESFGEFGSLVGLINILGILTSGLGLFLNKEVSKNISNESKIKYIYYESSKIFLIVGLIFFLFYFLLIPIILDFLKIDNYKIIFIVGLGIILSFVGISNNSVFRGLKNFKILSITTILNPLIKILVGLSLILVGYGIYGAIIGFIFAGFGSLIYSHYYLHKYFKNLNYDGNIKNLVNDFNKSKYEIYNFFLLSLFLSLLINFDLILAKNIFSSEIAGKYIGISIIGKFLIYLLLSIETVYYGQIMEHKREHVPINLILNPLILTVLGGIIVLILNYIFSNLILTIIKPELLLYKEIYFYITIYYIFIAIISIISKILIGWGVYIVNYILLFLCTLLIFLIYTYGIFNLESFIYCFLTIGIIGSLILGIMILLNIKKYRHI